MSGVDPGRSGSRLLSSPTALLCDTGALLDYLVVTAPDHRAFREVIDRSRTRYVPGLVLAEVDYFLRKERRAMGALMRDLSRGAFTYAAPTLTSLGRPLAPVPVSVPCSRDIDVKHALGTRKNRAK